MTFQSGEAWNGNAAGRKPGSRNRRTQELLDLLSSRGDKDPLDSRKADCTLDLDFAESLIADNHKIASNIIAEEELRLKIANSPHAMNEQTIRIEGGLPKLPGTNITMPELNGLNGHVIEGIPAPVPAVANSAPPLNPQPKDAA